MFHVYLTLRCRSLIAPRQQPRSWCPVEWITILAGTRYTSSKLWPGTCVMHMEESVRNCKVIMIVYCKPFYCSSLKSKAMVVCRNVRVLFLGRPCISCLFTDYEKAPQVGDQMQDGKHVHNSSAAAYAKHWIDSHDTSYDGTYRRLWELLQSKGSKRRSLIFSVLFPFCCWAVDLLSFRNLKCIFCWNNLKILSTKKL